VTDGAPKGAARPDDRTTSMSQPVTLPALPPGFRPDDRRHRVAALREAIAADAPLVLPGVANSLTALQVEQAGFEAVYLTGAGVSNVEYGLPDVGLIGLSDMAEAIRRVAMTTTLPVVVDADTGYGGPLSVWRTVQVYENAGAAAVQLEDQEMPKRCGHFDGKRLVTVDEMCAKLSAALQARQDGTVVIARTDALAVEGLAGALERGRAYADAGADVVFIEAPPTVEDCRTVTGTLSDVPLLLNVVEGGKTPELTAEEAGDLGYDVVLFANALQRVMARAAEEALAELREAGTTQQLLDRMLGWGARQALVGTDRADALEDHLRGLDV
jgi:2,3-dimethylmalate lyase